MVVTNNKLVKNSDLFVEGSYRDVLLTVRDLVYEGHELEIHPLFASIRMLFSPIRTVILSDNKKSTYDNEYSMKLISDSIQKYDDLMARRKPDFNNIDDYSYLDFELFEQALKELKKLA